MPEKEVAEEPAYRKINMRARMANRRQTETAEREIARAEALRSASGGLC